MRAVETVEVGDRDGEGGVGEHPEPDETGPEGLVRVLEGETEEERTKESERRRSAPARRRSGDPSA